MTRLFVWLAGMVLLVPAMTSAQSGDADAGKAASAVCAGCHGQDGNSPSPEFPNIAGQVPGYIADQLMKFKSGERENAVMAGIVAAISDEDMVNLDAYYASQTAQKGSITPDQEEMARAGEKIYRGGYEPYNIAACMGCHGPSGAGIPPMFPRLSGQHASYIESQLLAYKSGARKNEMMNTIAFALSEEQIKELALYISALY